MAEHKGDGAGLSATDLTELAESFQTISDTFRRLAIEQGKREKTPAKAGAGKGSR